MLFLFVFFSSCHACIKHDRIRQRLYSGDRYGQIGPFAQNNRCTCGIRRRQSVARSHLSQHGLVPDGQQYEQYYSGPSLCLPLNKRIYTHIYIYINLISLFKKKETFFIVSTLCRLYILLFCSFC